VVLWPKEVDNVDDLRLKTILKMIKCPHFNAKMNGLKEISKAVEEISNVNSCKQTEVDTSNLYIPEEKFADWLTTQQILSISLDSHIDQSQYSDKIRVLVEFIGDRLSMDELTQLWRLQDNTSLSVAENIQLIVASAAPEFNEHQLDLLYKLVHKSWLKEDERARLQLISFIGLVGRKFRASKQTEKVQTVPCPSIHFNPPFRS